jgi:hypothetical protein
MKSVLFGLMASTLLALGTMGCSSGGLDIPGDGQGGGAGGGGTGAGGGGTGTASTPPLCTTTGTTYAGFGGSTLGTDRVQAVQGADRGRMKPFTAMYTTAASGASNEFMRVSSYTPPILANNGATFSAPPANWYQEPEASAIGIYTSYRAAFQSCLQVTATGAEYSAAPTTATATTECTSWTRKFWSRDASPDELTACENVATNDTATEADVNKRWAYVCASVLNSAGFVSY